MHTIEFESGTYTGRARRHNGYYAGDFGTMPFSRDAPLFRRAPAHTGSKPAQESIALTDRDRGEQ